jgi:hypothetical protein
MGGFSRRAFLAGAVSLLASRALAQGDQSFLALRKAVWAWRDEPTQWAALESLCSAQRIEHIMLSLSKDARSSLARGDASLASQLRSMKMGGRSVWALMGEQDWVTSKKTSLPESLEDALQIQQRDALFDGFEFDIEPHLLPQWRAGDRQAVASQYLDLLSRIRSATGNNKMAVTAVPSYTELTMGDGKNLLWHIAHSVDRVSLMAYRDTPSAAIKYAQSSTAVFQSTKCPWRLGVLVNQSKESHVSYFGTPADQFKKDMVELDQSLRSAADGDYLGLIFEDSSGLSALLT